MSAPEGFDFTERVDGTEMLVRITYRGHVATTLRDGRAQQFIAEVESSDPQEVMARWTGNFKRGNERAAKNHPRNR